VLPNVTEILGVERGNTSAWAQAFRIDVRHSNDENESYFIKVWRDYVLLLPPLTVADRGLTLDLNRLPWAPGTEGRVRSNIFHSRHHTRLLSQTHCLG
jgi:hypothetical protein